MGIPNTADSQGMQLVREYNKEQGTRANWDTLWQEVADFCVPNKDDIYNSDVRGERKGESLYDGTAIHAADLLSSVMNSTLTNNSTNWFALSVDEVLMQSKPVKTWLKAVEDITHQHLNNSNFHVQNSETMHDQVTFGTGPMEVMEDKEEVIRFRSYPVYKLHYKENSKGVPDTVYKEFKFTGRQIVQEWGEDALKGEHFKAWREDMDKEMSILHVVKPRKDIKKGLKTAKNMPIASFYVSLNPKGHILHESGFHEMPYVIPRWSKINNEKYGRSPAMKALWDVKMLNAMNKIDLQGYQLTVAPPLMVPDRSFIGPIKATPFSMNYYRAGTDARVEPLFTGVRLDISEAKIQRMEDKVNQHFFLDQLKLIRGPQMTATEVEQRTDENLRILAPVLSRQNHEYLKPLITRVFGILFRANKYPPIPKELQGKEFQVQYTSLIAQAQRAAQASKINRFIGIVAPIIEIQPQVVDVLDGDAILRETAEQVGLDPKFLKSKKEVENIRNLRAQAQQQQAQQESQLTDSQIAKNTGS